ncbi:MAG TPA: putative toxin-antitoxin system toxin component, PIN family [Steroidobacteraceae bacterium]
MIVCFDTNVLVSAVATRGLCADIVNAALAEHQLIIGPTVLAELQQFLLRKLRLPATVVDEMIAFLRLNATIIAAAPELAIRGLDENDRALLAETIAGNANVLVTGDQELLRLRGHASIKILSPRGFWEMLRSD